MALGAGPQQVLRLVLREGMLLAFAGVVVGLAGTYFVGRLMKTILYQVNALDPAAISAVTAVLLLSALLACYIPARRATQVDPMVALRDESTSPDGELNPAGGPIHANGESRLSLVDKFSVSALYVQVDYFRVPRCPPSEQRVARSHSLTGNVACLFISWAVLACSRFLNAPGVHRLFAAPA